MKWKKTTDPNVIECLPYFILRCVESKRFLLGHRVQRTRANGGSFDECLGGFDSADEARAEAERHERTVD